MKIHPTASVDPRAELGDGVAVGPFSIIGPEVQIGAGTVIGPYVRIEGRVRIGRENRILHGAAIGLPPQDLGYRGEPTGVIIGDRNMIREYVTIHRATGEGQFTRIGDENFLMAYAHVAHNCRIGSGVILVNAAQLAGYVEVGDHAFISGLVGVHQFVRIGAYAMIGGVARVVQDVPPFMLAAGIPLRVVGLNLVGLRRKGFTPDRIRPLKEAYRLLYLRPIPLEEALEELTRHFPENPDIALLVSFIRNSRRGIVRRGRNHG